MSVELPHVEARVGAVFTRRPRAKDLGVPPSEVPGDAERLNFERNRVPANTLVEADEWGLKNSLEFHKAQRSRENIPKKSAPERGILVQVDSHNRELVKRDMKLRKPLPELVPGLFGENLYIEGGSVFHSGTVCVGDRFRVVRDGKEQKLLLLVRSPRRPCAKVDENHGQTYSLQGVRAMTVSLGLAGMFLSVLEHGDVREGDVLRLVSRPHPGWDIARISRLLYGHKTAIMMYASRPVKREEWMGTEEELRELADIPELAICEYKEELWNLLGRKGIGKYRDKRNMVMRLVQNKFAMGGAVALTILSLSILSYRRR